MTLAPITAPSLRALAHGFFPRDGGVSEGIYAGLNCGHGSGDATEAVRENRAQVAAHLGAEHLLSVHQVHSPEAVTVTGPWEGERPKADAMVTDRPGIALGILTADCAPVLFADREAGVIGAAHAGWRGALDGVTDATIEAIGPTISQRAYEVGPEFVERFLDEDPEHARFFAGGAGDRAVFDLPGFLLWRLREAGVADASWTGHCTYAEPDRFFSYRRATHAGEPDYGRMVAAIAL